MLAAIGFAVILDTTDLKGANDTMKHRPITLLRELLITQSNYWTLFYVILTILLTADDMLQTGKPALLLWGLLSFVPFLFYCMRTCISSFFLQLAAHGCLLILAFMLPAKGSADRALYVIMVLGYIIYSQKLRLTTDAMEDEEILPVVIIGISFGTMFLQDYMQITDWHFFYRASLIGIFCLYFLNYYLKHYLHFIHVNESSTGYIPEKEMLHSGMGLTIIYTLLAAGILFISTNIPWLKSILSLVKNGLVAFLRFLFSLLPKGTEAVPIVEEAVEPAGGLDTMVLPEARDPHWIWEVLEFLAVAFVLFLLLYIIVRGIKAVIAYLLPKLHRSAGSPWDAADSGVWDEREQCALAGRRKSSGRNYPGLLLSPNEKIRRLYRRKILSSKDLLTSNAKDSEALLHMTAKECGNLLDAPEMTAIYEKARYSQSPCSREDIRQMKKHT